VNLGKDTRGKKLNSATQFRDISTLYHEDVAEVPFEALATARLTCTAWQTGSCPSRDRMTFNFVEQMEVPDNRQRNARQKQEHQLALGD
jgi:hypothetical protein